MARPEPGVRREPSTEPPPVDPSDAIRSAYSFHRAKRRVRVPRGVELDLGATAKALGADLPTTSTVLEPRTVIVALLTGTIVTLLGAIPWNFGLAYAGFLLGQHWEQVAATLAPVVIPVAIVVVIILAAAWWFGRKLGEEGEAKGGRPVAGRV